ncbi:ABC transporter permease [Methanobacterium sp. MBAC-LM]|uniref:ABC transporter permease n=1 Tax=Methanobacterium sp. MBAC-LM TaxID=3412034 RepID=UPI003C79263C
MNLYKLGFNNIRRKKLRSSLTMLGIIIGAATILILMGTTAGLASAVKDQTSEYMYDVIIAPASSSGSYLMDPQTVSKVDKLSNIYDLQEVTVFSDEINGKTVTIGGTNDWKKVKIKSGGPGVVINHAVADKLGLNIGDKIKVKNQELSITGISNEEQVDEDVMGIYVNQSLAKQMAGNKVRAIYARTNGDPKTIANDIEKQVKGVSVETKSEKVAKVQEWSNKALLFMGMIAGIALVVGIISVVNTMMMSVMERTKELGVLKAIGFTNWDLKGSILFESGLLGFSGAVIGCILGIAGIILVAKMLNFTTYIPEMMPLWLIGSVIVGSTLLSILAGLYPAMRASKLNVVEALRHE